jgi:hypothetical protein
MAMTNAERQAKFRKQRRAEGLKRDWIAKKNIPTAANTAKMRFERFVLKKLSAETDLTAWEFYTFLLNQARKHKLDFSGYASIEYQEDREKVIQRNSAKKEKTEPPKSASPTKPKPRRPVKKEAKALEQDATKGHEAAGDLFSEM